MRINANQAAWGLRSQLGATVDLLDDLKSGNGDGIAGNESKPAGEVGNVFQRSPIVRRAQDAVSVGVSAKDEISRLTEFVSEAEGKWGQPVMAADVKAQMNGGALFAAQKAIRLTRMGRHPKDVTNHFTMAAGTVAGREIPARNLHLEKWAPIGTPSGKTVVISPGYLETGRTFDEQIQALNTKGHAVIVMDHQWAGQSDGKPGGIDSGYGVARDVAAATAFAAQDAKRDFGDDGTVILFGNSMGGGPGAFGAALLNDNGAIALEGAQMPKGVDLVLQAPFLGATPSVMNQILQTSGQIPMLNRIQLPGTGLPDITDDPRAEQLGAQGMVLEDVRAQMSAFKTAQPDIDLMLSKLSGGQRPSGRITVVVNASDTLADPSKWDMLKAELDSQVTLTTFEGTDHVMSQALGQQDHAIDALEKMLAK